MTTRILHVEDSAEDTLLWRKALETTGLPHELHQVAHCRAATTFLAANPNVGLIILDWNMPEISGHQFLKSVRAEPSCATIPILILTTSKSRHDVLEAYKAHANAFYVKPAEFAELVTLAKGILEHWTRLVTLPPSEASAA